MTEPLPEPALPVVDEPSDHAGSASARPLAAVKSSLPEGTIPVGLALFLAGIATYLFFKIGTTAVGGEDAFRPLQALWFATFALAPGFFLPLEQELGRALGHRRALKLGGRPVVAKVVRLGIVLGTLVAVGVLALGPLLSREYFDGQWILVAALVAAFLSYSPAHLARGVCSGSGRFRAYAIVMGADGIVRIVACVALWGLGITHIGAYAFAIALSPLPGALYVGLRGNLRTDAGPEASWREVTPNLGWLLIGSVFAAGLLNAGPVVLNWLAPEGAEWDERVTRFGYGVLLARVPLFMFQAVQAALLPRLSRLAADGDLGEFRTGLMRLLKLVGAVGVVGTLGALLLGPFALDLVYQAELAGSTLAILACGSGLYMVALALAQGVIALKGHSLVAAGWGTAMAAMVLGVWLGSDDVFRRVEIGLLASSLAAVIFFGFALRNRLQSNVRPDAGSVLEAMTDMPFET